MGQRNVRRTLLIQREGTMCMKTIGLIGSFRKNFDEIVAIKQYFQDNNLHVNNPIGNNLTKQGCLFVRCHGDNENDDDSMIQTKAIARLFKCDLVYVFVKDHFIGKTTCYEVGRLLQRGIPLYFSEKPDDFPLYIPSKRIISKEEVLYLAINGFETVFYSENNHPNEKLENEIICH